MLVVAYLCSSGSAISSAADAVADTTSGAEEVADAAIENPATDQAPPEAWYPRTLRSVKGTAVIYAPQIDAWTDFETIDAWVAFQITRSGSEDTYYGSIKFAAKTNTDVGAREVLLHDVVIHELTIEGLDEESDEYKLVHEAFTANSRTVPLDLVLEYLPEEMDIASAEGLNKEPPTIFTSTGPALLLSVETEPVFVPVDDGELQFVINTRWDVLRVGDDGPLYICYQDAWLTAPGFADSWQWAHSLPGQFGEIPDDPNWSNVQNCLPHELSALTVPEHAAPVVFYSANPAELLLLEGNPEWDAIGDGGLSYATNTKQELFQADDQVYFLVSGRWFEATTLEGPWTMASDLPESFQDIPPDNDEESHAKSYVRVSVPGTRESWEAALVASIPRTAEIARGAESSMDLTVNYAGDPVFTSIESTDIEMAVNTSSQVLRYDGTYYLCYNATWLTGFSASGPWQFADSIPAAFSTIPPSSPAYNTTFVSIDGSDPNTIDYAYTSGYEGAYVSDSTVVYGTGYPSPAVTLTIAYGIHDGWWGYPYYPWPPTYGYGSWYNPGTGRYGEMVVGYGPYGAAGGAAVYNPQTGTYARGQAVWDNNEFAGRGFAYNPNTDTSIARNRYIDFEDNEGWSQRVAQRGDEWRYTQSQWQDGHMVTEFESSRGTEGEVFRQREGETIISEGTVTRGNQEATFESTRERQGDTIVTEGTISGDNRSASFDSVIDDGRYVAAIQGSEGGSGSVDRQLENGEITGGGSLTKDGKTIETDVTRTAEGVQREFETGSGGQGVSMRSGDDSAFAYQSGSGDVYAGRDGNVYQKTDDGWAPVANPGSQASTGSATTDGRSTTTERTGATERAGNADRSTEQLPAGGFANAQTSRNSAGTAQYGGGLAGSQYGGGGLNLERDFQNRQNGFNRYAQHQSLGGSRARGGSSSRRRRR